MTESAAGLTAFDRYRRSPNEKTTLPRLLLGALLIVVAWLAVTVALIVAGFSLQAAFGSLPETLTFDDGDLFGRFMATQVGFVTALLTFSGIWLGTWLAMRFLHRERLGRLFGNSGRISRPGFLNGLIAVLITSILGEIGLYLLQPELERGPIGIPAWLLFLVPAFLLAFVQISSEEVLFRGYLMRGLAYRFRSPWVWALLPTLAFTALHWDTGAPLTTNIAVFASIGMFAAMLVLLVYVTGNLGAAMGAHLGNNITGFVLVSHDSSLSSVALFKGATLGALTSTPGSAAAVVAASVVSVLLCLLLLAHPRSPLRVEADLGRDAPARANRPQA